MKITENKRDYNMRTIVSTITEAGNFPAFVGLCLLMAVGFAGVVVGWCMEHFGGGDDDGGECADGDGSEDAQ